MKTLADFYKGKRIFLTGHTGFKGSWLLTILEQLGAQVMGYSLAPLHREDLFPQINGNHLCFSSIISDVKEQRRLQMEMAYFQPDLVFHLAAQALVRKSYREPVETMGTNIMGTVNVLEAIRQLETPCVGIMITTDKVYENPEKGVPFKETDRLGGHDPYSSSKAAAEMVIASYLKSFFPRAKYAQHQKAIMALRAGNVIGGGDYSEDRIIPDIVRAIHRGEAVLLRNPQAVRPWQHVLEPLFAYLQIGQSLSEQGPSAYLPSYNIGPEDGDMLTVEEVTQIFIKAYGKGSYQCLQKNHEVHEAGLLLLDNSAIKKDFSWQPKLTAAQAVQWTADWYADEQSSALDKTRSQIERYRALL